MNAADTSGATPLDEAVWKGQTDTVKLLICRGANVQGRSGESGATPLHEAAVKGHRDIAALLLDAGAPIASKDKFGATPLDEALKYRHADSSQSSARPRR